MENNDDRKRELGHYSDHHYRRKCFVLLELLIITTMKCKQASVNPPPPQIYRGQGMFSSHKQIMSAVQLVFTILLLDKD